jgi:ActR/RegA family two-component response regulator
MYEGSQYVEAGGLMSYASIVTEGPVMKKILIVEDDSDFREILHRFITKLGHHAIKARNSKEAIECAEAEQPDLIFTQGTPS